MTPAEIRERRKALHLTQEQLAECLPVSPRTVEDWEQGRRKPQSYLWRALEHLEREMAAQED